MQIVRDSLSVPFLIPIPPLPPNRLSSVNWRSLTFEQAGRLRELRHRTPSPVSDLTATETSCAESGVKRSHDGCRGLRFEILAICTSCASQGVPLFFIPLPLTETRTLVRVRFRTAADCGLSGRGRR